MNIPKGHTLKVTLVSSGGKKVTFTAYNTKGNHKLGHSPALDPGSLTATIWTNNTGRTINVQVKADASGVTNVVAKGHYSH